MKLSLALVGAIALLAPSFVAATCGVKDQGSPKGVAYDDSTDALNTAEVQENQPSVNPLYKPLDDSFCFNQEYNPPSFDHSRMVEMYKDFQKIFEWGFENKMGFPLQSVSEDNNNVSNNRFPGMYLRMCFHDNTVDPSFPDFQDYIDMHTAENGSWNGFGKFLETSGADASLLTCEDERLHPNNDYDKTASRVLYTMQVEGVISGGQSLKSKYHLSYADLLHNGCIASVIYLTRKSPSSILETNPMKFGRHDACFLDDCETKHELCGSPNILPSLGLTATQTNNWFKTRGMSECLWLSTMWTQ